MQNRLVVFAVMREMVNMGCVGESSNILQVELDERWRKKKRNAPRD